MEKPGVCLGNCTLSIWLKYSCPWTTLGVSGATLGSVENPHITCLLGPLNRWFRIYGFNQLRIRKYCRIYYRKTSAYKSTSAIQMPVVQGSTTEALKSEWEVNFLSVMKSLKCHANLGLYPWFHGESPKVLKHGLIRFLFLLHLGTANSAVFRDQAG